MCPAAAPGLVLSAEGCTEMGRARRRAGKHTQAVGEGRVQRTLHPGEGAPVLTAAALEELVTGKWGLEGDRVVQAGGGLPGLRIHRRSGVVESSEKWFMKLISHHKPGHTYL